MASWSPSFVVVNRRPSRWLAGCLVALAASTGSATTIALATAVGDARTRAVADLATVELGAVADVVVLERDEVDRLLAEHELSLAFGADAAAVVEVGRLAGAEVVVVIGASGAHQPMWVISFDAGSGVRLGDETVVDDTVDRQAAAIATAVGAANRKRGAGGAARPVCLLAVRNADLPRSMDSVVESVAELLARRIVRSPDTVLLERHHLDRLNLERELPTVAPATERLLAALLTLDLDVGRHGADGLAASAVVADAAGRRISSVRATTATRDPAALAAALADALAGPLALAPAPLPFDTTAEAQRFAAEARLLASHGRHRSALRAAEAAHALAPEDPELTLRLVKSLVGYASQVAHGTPTSDDIALALAQAGRGFDLLDVVCSSGESGARSCLDLGLGWEIRDATSRLIARLATHGSSSLTPPSYFRWPPFLAADLERPSRYRLDLDHLPAQLHPSFLRLQSRWRRWFVTEDVARHRADRHLRGLADHLEAIVAGANQWAWPDEASWSAAVIAEAEAVLELVASSEPLERSDLTHLRTTLRAVTVTAARHQERDTVSWPRWQALWQRMEDHPLALVRAYGRLGRLADRVAADDSGPDQVGGALTALVDDLIGLADEAARQGEVHLQRTCFLAAVDSLRTLPLIALQRREPAWLTVRLEVALHLLEAASARGRLDAPVVVAATTAVASVAGADVDTGLPCDRLAAAVARSSLLLATDAPRREERVEIERALTATDQVLAERCRHQAAGDPGRLLTAHALDDGRRDDDAAPLLLAPAVSGDAVYALGIDGPRDLQRLTAWRWSLTSGPPTRLGSLPIGSDRWPAWHVRSGAHGLDYWHRWGEVRASAAHGDSYLVALDTRGVAIFARDGSVRLITTSDGLPSDRVNALASLGDTLYVGSRDGTLSAVDLATGTVDVVASNRRKERRSPFDDGLPFVVRHLQADPQRRRLVALITVADVEQSGRTTLVRGFDAASSGVWELTADTRQWRRLAPLFVAESFTQVTRTFADRGRFITSEDRGSVVVDLAADAVQLVHRGSFVGTATPLTAAPDGRPVTSSGPLAVGHPLLDGSTSLTGPFLLRDGWLVTASPWGRLGLDGRGSETFAPLSTARAAFSPGECLLPLADGRVLAGDGFGLWLVELP